MSNNIEELSYDDLVALCVRKQIDAIIQGEPLANAIKDIVSTAVYWRHQKTIAEQEGK